MITNPLNSLNRNKASSGQEVLSNYENIRSMYKTASNGASVYPPLTDPAGLFKSTAPLNERYAGFDKLFMVLVQNVIDDPDYALRKDPKVYQRMLRDPQIYYCLEVRKAATTNLEWMVAPPDAYAKDPSAIEIAAQAERRLQQIPNFSELLSHLLDSLLAGLAIVELCWKQDEETGEYIVQQFFPAYKDRFKFSKEGELRLVQPMQPYAGIQVPDYKFITHTFKIKDGSWQNAQDAGYIFYGVGLADTPLYHYFYFKITALRYLLKSLEKNAGPLKVVYTGPQNPQLAERLHSIMLAVQNDSVVAIPGKKGEVNVDMMSIPNFSQLYIGFIEYIDKMITRAILGQELMTEMPANGAGSYALGSVHQSVFARLVAWDRDRLAYTINRSLMKYDHALNMPNVPTKYRPVFKFRNGSLADAAGFLQSVQMAVGLGLSISENQVREAIGLREPVEGEGIIGMGMPSVDSREGDVEDEGASRDSGDSKKE